MSAGQLLYSHTRPRRIQLIKVFAYSQTVAWSYMGYVTYDVYDAKKKLKKSKLSEDARTVDRIAKIIGESSVTKAASWLCIGVGFAMSIGAALWSRQSIKTVHLLNRNRVSISTYGFPRQKSFTVPIAEVQSVNPNASASYLRLKVAGEPLQFIVDRDGTFPLPKLFHAVTAPSYTM